MVEGRMSERWQAVLRGLGWLWLAFPLLSAALLLLWGLWQQATARGDVGWAVTYSQNPLDWLQGLALWLGPGLALLWAGRRRSAL